MRRVLICALSVFVIGLVGCNPAQSDPEVNKDVQSGKPNNVQGENGPSEFKTDP